jgi:hypothetical protein
VARCFIASRHRGWPLNSVVRAHRNRHVSKRCRQESRVVALGADSRGGRCRSLLRDPYVGRTRSSVVRREHCVSGYRCLNGRDNIFNFGRACLGCLASSKNKNSLRRSSSGDSAMRVYVYSFHFLEPMRPNNTFDRTVRHLGPRLTAAQPSWPAAQRDR